MDNKEIESYGLGQLGNTIVQDELVKFVCDAYKEAKEHKDSTGASARLIRNLRAKLSQYAPEDADMVKGIDVYIGLCALKQRSAESWLIDIGLNNIEAPWTLEATPEPDLPDRLKEQVIDMLISELPTMNSYAALKDRTTQLKSAVQQLSKEAAEKSVRRMETKIKDQMLEGNWLDTYKSFISYLTTYPTAMMRGPILVGKPVAKWDKDELKVEQGSILNFRVISPFNAFPSPNATDPQNGSYFIEEVDYTQADLHALIGVNTFHSENIRKALEAYSEGYRGDDAERAEENSLLEKLNLRGCKTDIRIKIYNGVVQGKLLINKGVMVKDPQKFYEAEIWVAGDYLIRAVLNPNPLGKRPIYGTSFAKVEGKFWGQSPIDLVYDVERTCNAATRAIIRNMGYSSGPIGEVVEERLADTDSTDDVAPYKIFRVGPDITGTGAPAFKFHNVGSIANELMGVFERYMKVADDLSMVPAYVLGNPQVAGAGRTLGGLSMMMGNAAKGIKNSQLNVDRDVISEAVESMYMFNMKTSKDMSIKSDARVIARGATGLLQRELAQTRTVEVLQLLTPYAQGGLLPQEIIVEMLRNVLRNTGMDIDKFLPDPNDSFNMKELAGLLGPQVEAFNRGTGSPVPLPPQSQPNTAPNPTPVNLPQGA